MEVADVDKADAAEEEPQASLPENLLDLQEPAEGDPVEESAALDQLALTPLNPHSTGKVKKRMVKKGRDLKAKKTHSESELKDQAEFDQSGKNQSSEKDKLAVDSFSTPAENKSAAMIRAEEVQSNLEPGFPSFVKPLVRSHVGSCFWMGLPGSFCKEHLPRTDTSITLEDEYGKQYELKYIAHKTGLSAGWRQFSAGHDLVEGDVLVFQLVEPCKLKVYIVKADNLTEVDGALGLLNLDVPTKIPVPDDEDIHVDSTAGKRESRKRQRSLPLANLQKKTKHSHDNDSEDVDAEVLEGVKPRRSEIQFKDIKGLENFIISIDGMIMDPELPEHIRCKYYELCCSQNAFLHENILKGINLKLIVGAISEIVNIADAIATCTITTTQDEFSTWERALKSLEILGMNVGFLRARVKRLRKLASESENAIDTKKYIEAKRKRAHLEEEIRNLEMMISELEEASEKYDADIESLKPKAEAFEHRFMETVTAPW